ARHTISGKDVVVVQRCSMHLNDDFPGLGNGIGKLGFVLDTSRSTVFIDDCCFHGICFLKTLNLNKKDPMGDPGFYTSASSIAIHAGLHAKDKINPTNR